MASAKPSLELIKMTQGIGDLKEKAKAIFIDVKYIFKSQGIKGVVKKYGWKIFAVFFMYYLIRDSILYILLPWLVAKHFIN